MAIEKFSICETFFGGVRIYNPKKRKVWAVLEDHVIREKAAHVTGANSFVYEFSGSAAKVLRQ
jgi:hypothetical protein